MPNSDLTSVDEIIAELRRMGDPKNIAGMARYGIKARQAFGVSAVPLRALARRVGKNHALAGRLWATDIFEARMLAAFIAEPARLTRQQARAWAKDFENWADCDGVCIHFFRKAAFAHEFAVECSRRKPEFVKRTGFTLMATLAVHDKAAPDEVFLDYLPRIAHAADDERNGVKKAVNWALRQIGKRNPRLRRAALRTADAIHRQGTPAAKWIASDARRELKRRDLLGTPRDVRQAHAEDSLSPSEGERARVRGQPLAIRARISARSPSPQPSTPPRGRGRTAPPSARSAVQPVVPSTR